MRIVSLAPSNTEILYALGLQEQIVAVTHLCKYPLEAQGKPQIGSWIKTEPERIKSFQPDLIFTSYYLPPQLANGAYDGPGQIVHLNPRTLKDVMDSILQVGGVTGKRNRAQDVVAEMEKRIDSVSRQSAKLEYKPRVYTEEWFDPPMVGGNWVPELIALAGGREDLIHPGEASREVSLAELQAYDPDLVVLHWCGWGSRDGRDKVYQRENWNTLRPVRERNLHSVDDSLLNCPGPRLVEGLQVLSDLISSIVPAKV